MTTFRAVNLTGSSPLTTFRVVKLSGTGSTPTNPKLRVVKLSGTGNQAITVADIDDVADLEPRATVIRTAVLASGSPGTPTWAWTQVSGPTVTLSNANTDTVSFVSPSAMPGAEVDVVLGVTVTINSVTSPQVTARFSILPQTRWVWNGSSWIGTSVLITS